VARGLGLQHPDPEASRWILLRATPPAVVKQPSVTQQHAHQVLRDLDERRVCRGVSPVEFFVQDLSSHDFRRAAMTWTAEEGYHPT
jgi:hypothetical protein